MELCISTRCIPNSTAFNPYVSSLRRRFSLPLKSNSIALNNSGLHHHNYSFIKATASEDTPSETNQYVTVEADYVNYSPTESTNPENTSTESNQYVKEETDNVELVNEGQPEENSGFGGFGVFKEDDAVAADDQLPQFDFLTKLKGELDLEDSYSIAVLGVGGITALWLAANIVGAIDHIPLFPKLMELVGLGYTIWFSTRYLLFKRNRDELASKIKEIKQEVLGSKN